MMYSLQTVDGVNLGDRWTANGDGTLLTPGQGNFLMREINLQMQGFGKYEYDKSLSQEANEKLYFERYIDYWGETPGEGVKKKE